MKVLKSVIALSTATMLLAGCSDATNVAEGNNGKTTSTEYVDSYTSASKSKSLVDKENWDKVTSGLVEVSSDLATLAESKKDGYIEPEKAALAQIMSVNPDGSVGLSTIHAWKYEKNEKGNDTVTIELTDGQNAKNLAEVGKRGTLLVKNEVNYLLHLKVSNIDVLEFSQENFDNGLFNSAYSGADSKASQFRITFEVLSIESAPAVMFQ